MDRARDDAAGQADRAARVLDGPTPKYAQLREILRRMVEHELPPDTPIPSERDLAERYGVSRLTVRSAVGRLVDEGLLRRVRGRGTFTAHRRIDLSLHLVSFTEDMRRRGLTPSSKVLSIATAVPPEPVRRTFGLTPRASAYRIRRLRLADGLPFAVEDGWYHPGVVPSLLDLDLTGSIYAQLAQRHGVRFDTAYQTVTAATAGTHHARLLELRTGAPLLVFQRVSRVGGRAAEDTTSWYRGDRYRLTVSLDTTSSTRAPNSGHITKPNPAVQGEHR